jgi:conserved domain protein
MRIDKNILYILAFFGLMLIVNSLIISPMKEENRDLALQIESIKNNDSPDDQEARSIRRSKKGPDMARDLGLYEMSNKDLSIESMEVMEGNEYRQYEISLSGKGDSLLKFVQGLEAMDKRLVVDSISYDGQGQSKYVIKLHFFD